MYTLKRGADRESTHILAPPNAAAWRTARFVCKALLPFAPASSHPSFAQPAEEAATAFRGAGAVEALLRQVKDRSSRVCCFCASSAWRVTSASRPATVARARSMRPVSRESSESLPSSLARVCSMSCWDRSLSLITRAASRSGSVGCSAKAIARSIRDCCRTRSAAILSSFTARSAINPLSSSISSNSSSTSCCGSTRVSPIRRMEARGPVG